jgi:hypothetical protein
VSTWLDHEPSVDRIVDAALAHRPIELDPAARTGPFICDGAGPATI